MFMNSNIHNNIIYIGVSYGWRSVGEYGDNNYAHVFYTIDTINLIIIILLSNI